MMYGCLAAILVTTVVQVADIPDLARLGESCLAGIVCDEQGCTEGAANQHQTPSLLRQHGRHDVERKTARKAPRQHILNTRFLSTRRSMDRDDAPADGINDGMRVGAFLLWKIGVNEVHYAGLQADSRVAASSCAINLTYE